MREADYEARRERRERERAAGEAFQKVLREKLDAPLRVEDLMGRGKAEEGGDDAA
jgi:hypothetical protein